MLELFKCQKMVEGMQLLGGSPFEMAVLAALTILLGAGMFLLVNLVFKGLWNTTIPGIFGFNEISFWQSFRLLVILSLLLGGLGGHGMV